MPWYYAEQGKQVGPVADAEFEQLVRSGRVTGQTLVWREGMPDWRPYGAVVAPAAAAAVPAVPAPAAAATAVAAAVTRVDGVCSQCRRTFPADDMIRYGELWVCGECKPAFFQRLREGAEVAGDFVYAGFWIRVGAKLIDSMILWAVGFVTGLVAALGGTVGILVNMALQIALAAAYTTFFVGRFGATPGKMACGLQVVRPDGGPVSYLRALGRHFAESLSGLILGIGYLMVAFDDEKRALHDRICDTRVIRKS